MSQVTRSELVRQRHHCSRCCCYCCSSPDCPWQLRQMVAVDRLVGFSATFTCLALVHIHTLPHSHTLNESFLSMHGTKKLAATKYCIFAISFSLFVLNTRAHTSTHAHTLALQRCRVKHTRCTNLEEARMRKIVLVANFYPPLSRFKYFGYVSTLAQKLFFFSTWALIQPLYL